MDREFVKEKFQKLTVWKRGGERAPHKPLLVLLALGHLLNRNIRFADFEEINNSLSKLLRDFGPDRKSYHPEYPFWRLQNDGIWEVTEPEKLTVMERGDVKKSELIRNRIQGGFKDEVYKILQSDKKLVGEIVQELLESNFPSSIHEDILTSVGIDSTLFQAGPAKRNPEFRNKILRAYEYRCAICGFDVHMDYNPIALEAAHIKWHNAGGPDVEINGLALCSLHHKLFDRGAFTLTSDCIIMVSDRVFGSCGFDEWLMNYHGKKINPPQRTTYLPNQEYCKWHVKEVFHGEHREV